MARDSKNCESLSESEAKLQPATPHCPSNSSATAVKKQQGPKNVQRQPNTTKASSSTGVTEHQSSKGAKIGLDGPRNLYELQSKLLSWDKPDREAVISAPT